MFFPVEAAAGHQTDAAKTLAQAVVGGRPDYCNSLLYGVSKDLLRRLRRVQNAAARFFSGARKYDHISPVLRDLPWLPLRQKDNLQDRNFDAPVPGP